MKRTAAAVGVVGLALALLPAYVLLARGDHEAGSDWVNFLEDVRVIATERLREETHQQVVAGIHRNILEKLRLANRAADGGLSLPDAAARFRRLDRASPRFHWEEFRHAYPGRSDDERHCREVISFVRAALINRPDRQGDVARLQAELEGALRTRGAFTLPACPEAAGGARD